MAAKISGELYGSAGRVLNRYPNMTFTDKGRSRKAAFNSYERSLERANDDMTLRGLGEDLKGAPEQPRSIGTDREA